MIPFLLAHWKGETLSLAIITGIGLTWVKFMALVQWLAVWDAAIVERMIVSAFIAAVFSFGATLLLRRKAAALQKLLDFEKADKERIQRGHEDLLGTVAKLRLDFTRANEKLAVMDTKILPLYEFATRRFAEVLTHPESQFELTDNLLKIVIDPKRHLTFNQNAELQTLMKEREHDPSVPRKEQLVAGALPYILELAAIEATEVDAVTAVQLVSSTVQPK